MATEKKNSQKDHIKQKHHIVAFIDFLGASSKMKNQFQSTPFLNKINKIYSAALKLLETSEKMTVRIFSDNILVAVPIDSKGPLPVALQVINFCRWFQAYALYEGALVRGAITSGLFYSNEIFVYGEALVKAYEMESLRAIYPRIIVDKNIWGHTALNALQQTFPNELVQDVDGEWYLDFCFPCIVPNDKQLSTNSLIKVRGTILQAFSLPSVAEKEKPKYCWLANKFNTLCDKHNFSAQKIKMDCNNEPEPNAFYDDEYDTMLNGDK